ncbi:MAG: tetratricopeptide repeat protein [Candidatus Lokiarchaeota archaeon]|nr:tetratricopeptide repeat protein [Candidatus Lokiarchaeota archaeon]
MSDNNKNIEKYISHGKYQEALEKLLSIKKERSLSEEEIFTYKFLEIFICLDKGEFQKGREIADEMIKESKDKKNLIREVDAILGKTENSICLGLFDESLELIKTGETLLVNIKDQTKKIISQKKAYFCFLKGRIYAEKYELYIAIEHLQESVKLRKETDDQFGLIFSLLNLGVSNGSIGNFNMARKYSEESLIIAKDLDVEVGIIWNLINLGGVEYHVRNLDKAISYAEQCLAICKPKDYKHSSTLCYDIIGHSLFEKGELDRALQFFKKSLDYRLKTGYMNLIAQSYFSIGNVYNQKGELKKSLEYFNKILKIPEVQEDLRSKPAYLTSIGKIYGDLGDFNTAKRYLLEAMDLLKGIKVHIFYFLNFKVSLAKIYHYLIELSVNNNEIENLDHYLSELHEMSKEFTELKHIEQLYRLNKAIILKSSDRLMDKMEAGTIFKGIAEEEILDHEITIGAMTNLCDVLISELELTGDKRILQEIEQLSDKLLEIAKSQYLYDVLAETYFFKAKISLLHLNIDETRSLLTKAQNTANKYGLWALANKISNEHDTLLTHMDEWEAKIQQNIPLQERLDNVSHEFLFSKMVKSNFEDLSEETDIPVYLLIIKIEDGECLFSKSFQDGNLDDSGLIAGFISAINLFGKEAFSSSGSIDRIKHGEHLIILQSKGDLLFGYVFKGQSYSAISKLNTFSDFLAISTNNFKNMLTSIQKENEIPEEMLSIITQLINRIFLPKKNN